MLMMTEREYRRLRRISYSSLKCFADGRMNYYKLYESGPWVDEDEDDNDALRIGTVSDCIAFEPEDFDNRFVVSTVTKPGGQMGQFLDKLFKHTKQSLSQDGVVTRSIQSLMHDAYTEVAFNHAGEKIAFKRKSFEQVVEEFDAGPGMDFYRQQRQSLDKKLIEPGDEERAQKVVEKLYEHTLTKDLMSLKTGGKYRVFKQPKITFIFNRVECKSMLDLVIVNDELKIIQPFDLKTTYNPENFGYNYLKYRYYLQAALYDIALSDWANNNGMGDYEIKPMKFIVADSNSKYDPLLYVCTQDNLLQGRMGFTIDGREYVGIEKLVEDLQWHREHDLWSVSKDNFERGGICAIKIYE